MRKEGVLVVQTLKDSSVCFWMNLGAMYLGLWLDEMED